MSHKDGSLATEPLREYSPPGPHYNEYEAKMDSGEVLSLSDLHAAGEITFDDVIRLMEHQRIVTASFLGHEAVAHVPHAA